MADAKAALDTLGAPRSEDRTLAIAMRDSLAIALGKTGQLAAAAAEFRRAIAELEAMGRGRTKQAGILYHNLGALLSRPGRRWARFEPMSGRWTSCAAPAASSPVSKPATPSI